ncbi:MAG: type IV secretory system conjugative DNA transfer family protein [Eubacterium ventriosum]
MAETNKVRIKYISELLGKGTIDKKSSGETRGRQGSSSRNFDVLGRELMTPDEARKLDNKKCLIFIKDLIPLWIINLFRLNILHLHGLPMVKEKHIYTLKKEDSVVIGPPLKSWNTQSLAYFERLKDKEKMSTLTNLIMTN